MIKPTHFIETYKDSKGEIKTGMPFPIDQEPYQVLGNKVKGWTTLIITKFRMNENDTKRSQNNKS